jgi:hypothetical protein
VEAGAHAGPQLITAAQWRTIASGAFSELFLMVDELTRLAGGFR